MNGYTSYDAWNVSLWLHNDEGMYNVMMHGIKKNAQVNDAARYVLALMTMDSNTTPDGAYWTLCNVVEAIEDEHAEYWGEA